MVSFIGLHTTKTVRRQLRAKSASTTVQAVSPCVLSASVTGRNVAMLHSRVYIIYNMKTIAITIDTETLTSIDELIAHSEHLRNRSAVVRTALHEFAERERRRQAEECEREIFRKHRRRLSRQARALIADQARA